MDAPLRLRLVGGLRLTDAQGVDRTPRGAKAKGLLALVALGPGRRRARRWIEAQLWSGRGPEQAAGSLRQVLTELRAALGPHAGHLGADRGDVTLSGLVVDVEEAPEEALAALATGRDLLESHGIREQAFHDWLDEQRHRLGLGPIEPSRGLPFRIGAGIAPAGAGGFMTAALADAIGHLVSDFALVEVYGATAAVRLGPAGASGDGGGGVADGGGLALLVEAAEREDRLHVVLSLAASASGRVLWSRHAVLPLGEEDAAAGPFPSLVFEAAEATLTALPRLLGRETGPLRAEALAARALDHLFSFDAARMRQADVLLAEANEVAPSPRFLAWRALLRQAMAIERTEPDPQGLLDEADRFARHAIEAAPRSGLVLALASEVEVMLHGNPDAGGSLARDALALSPHNAFAHAGLAGSLLRNGRPAEALKAALTGARLASRSGFLHWWEVTAGLSCLAAGDLRGAVAHFEAARARAPRFRSPLRHLVFLHLQAGATERAAAVHQQLLRLEPDFSVERVREDPAYPAGTLRRAGLVPPRLRL